MKRIQLMWNSEIELSKRVFLDIIVIIRESIRIQSEGAQKISHFCHRNEKTRIEIIGKYIIANSCDLHIDAFLSVPKREVCDRQQRCFGILER